MNDDYRDAADRLRKEDSDRIENETSWLPISLAGALRGDGISPPVLLRREDGVCLLYKGRIHWFQGEPESLKSWLALIAAKEALDNDGKVLYLDFEDDEDGIVERLRAISVPDDVIDSPRFVYLRPEEPLYDKRGEPTAALADFERTLIVGYDIGIIDGVSEAMVTEGLEIIGNTDAALFMRRVAGRIARTGAVTVGIDHVAKNTSGGWAIGGQHKKAGLTGAAYAFDLKQTFGHGLTGKARITCEKDRPGRVRPHLGDKNLASELVVVSYPDGGVSHQLNEPSTSDTPAEDLVQKIREHLLVYPGAAKRAVRELGHSGAVDDAVKWMRTEGEIEIKQVGMTHQHYLTELGRQRADEGSQT